MSMVNQLHLTAGEVTRLHLQLIKLDQYFYVYFGAVRAGWKSSKVLDIVTIETPILYYNLYYKRCMLIKLLWVRGALFCVL